MLAGAAATVVVHHDAGADPGATLVDLATHRSHHAARFVTGNDRPLELAKSKRRGFFAGRAIELEIAAAHARRFDADDDIVRPRRRIRKGSDLQLPSAEKSHSTHRNALQIGRAWDRSNSDRSNDAGRSQRSM